MVTNQSNRGSGRTLERDEQLKARARRVIPNCTQTKSKGPSKGVQGISPTFIERAEGCHVWDADGNEYVANSMANSAIILGHNYPAVTEAVTQQLPGGTAFAKPHPIEVEVAELLVEMVPCAEMVRFAKNGNDVTAAAARLARAHTGRDVIATNGYHGWPDVWAGAYGGLGVPDSIAENTIPFRFNDLESVERIFEENPDDVAAIAVCPMVWEHPEEGFLEGLREIADREDAILIFDEVRTGFRFAPGGAQELFGVTPDLGCFAKSIANGYPLAALAGRADLMQLIGDGSDKVTFTSTFAGETLSLAAGRATVETHLEEPVHEHIVDVGGRLKDGFNALSAEHGLQDCAECIGHEASSTLTFREPDGGGDRMARSLFAQECHERGVLSLAHSPCYSHTDEDVEHTLEVYDEAFDVLASAIEDDAVADRLRGEPIGAPVQV